MKPCKHLWTLVPVFIFLYVFVITPLSVWHSNDFSVKATTITPKVEVARKHTTEDKDVVWDGFLGGWICEPQGGKLNCMER